MGRGNALAKRKDETDLQWRSRLARLRQDERQRFEPIVTPEAANQGDYRTGFVTHVETNTKAHTLVNRGGTPLDRWDAAGKITTGQMAAIGLCHRLWRLAGLSQRVTATYGERLAPSSSADFRAVNEIEAREDLHRIQDYIPAPYWDVFENVCRHDIPAGVAGSSLGYGQRSAEDRAHMIVCFVADLIAMRERL